MCASYAPSARDAAEKLTTYQQNSIAFNKYWAILNLLHVTRHSPSQLNHKTYRADRMVGMLAYVRKSHNKTATSSHNVGIFS